MDERERIRSAMDRALSGLREAPRLAERILMDGKETKPMKKKLSLAAAILAAAVLLGMTAALAAGELGLFGLLEGSGHALPEAVQEMVTVPARQQTLPWAHVRLEVLETLRAYDFAQVLLKVTPLSEDMLLVPEAWLDTESMPEADGRQVIVLREHAPTLRSGNGSSAVIGGWRTTFFPQEDGSVQALLFMAHDFDAAQDDLSVFMRFETIPARRTAAGTVLEKGAQEPANITFDLPGPMPDMQQIFTASGAGLPVLIPECGLRIDRVTITGTALYTDISVACTVINEDIYKAPGADGSPRELLVWVLDENGSAFPWGMRAPRDGSAPEADLLCSLSAAPMDAPPEGLRVIVCEAGQAEPVASVYIPLEQTE